MTKTNDLKTKENKEVKFEIILLIGLELISLILLKSDNKFYLNQVLVAMVMNSLIFFLVYVFFKSLKLYSTLRKIMTFLVLIWLCVLPIIFYKVYSNDTTSFSYNKEYLSSLQNINKNDINLNEKIILKNRNILKNELLNPIFKKQLSTKSDTLILTDNYIIFSQRILRDGDYGIKFYDRFSGKFLFQFEKKNSLLDSYNYFIENLNFKFNKIQTPEVGISYFNFWCSSIISFKDNLIIPLRNWIVTLNFIYILIILTPIFNYTREKYLKRTK